FAYFLLATQKKVGAPPGAYPGPQAHAEPQKKQRTVNNSNASGPSPQPSPQRGEGARRGRGSQAGGLIMKDFHHGKP
ncbi:MAG TPA: hypothetical protein PLK10_13540, partial [Ottowia sp.]|nr:hypothetical protein [Ottowia sp.]